MNKHELTQYADDIFQMAETQGWRHLTEWIEGKIAEVKRQLFCTDFRDLAEVKVLQAKGEAYREILGYVAQWLSRREQLLKEREE